MTEKKHAKFSASGMDRYEACPGSAELSEGQPDKSSPWAEEGTKAHGVLEEILRVSILVGAHRVFYPKMDKRIDPLMIHHGTNAANIILGLWGNTPGSDIMVETKVNLGFIHEDAGGTFDGAVVEAFGTLHVFDYKYGAGVSVSPQDNLQMITYALGLAHQHGWNFKRIRMWIIQPRIKGYDGPTFWEIPIMELKEVWLPRISDIIHTAIQKPDLYIEGPHCHWCKAKRVCPLKTNARIEKAKQVFSPVGGATNGKEKEKQKSEADWRKEAKAKKGRKAKTQNEKGDDGYEWQQ